MCAVKNKDGYEITCPDTELPIGTKFSVRPGPVSNCQLCLVQINDKLVVGRYLDDPLGGCNWIMRPSNWIQITDADRVVVVGAVNAPK